MPEGNSISVDREGLALYFRPHGPRGTAEDSPGISSLDASTEFHESSYANDSLSPACGLRLS